MNILIIDDDSVDRMSVARTLSDSEFKLTYVDQTGYPQEGISLAKKKKYDVILLDYNLPPSSGIEVLRELRGSSDFSTAIVMLSHSNDEELAVKCIEAGAQDFIMKSEVTISRLKRSILLSTERHGLEQKVRESHDQLRRLAEQDTLTGLSNRYLFDEALKDAIPQTDREGSNLALLFLDLDKFKHINDTLGHVAGDYFLKMVARRLEKPIRDGDKLCRLGGDEFAILVHDLERTDQVRLLVQRIFKSLEAPVNLEGREVEISVSIGVATYPDCAKEPVELMKCADVAMYRAKASGRNQVQYYSKDFHDYIENKVRIEGDLKRALELDQFVLHYQPQVDSITYQLKGIEVLIRWQHPQMGIISPDDFIPIAEEIGFINEIGRWVLDKACCQFRQWLALSGTESLTFSIAANLSARQLKDSGLVEYLNDCMARYALPPTQLELELTENSLETSLAALDMLRCLSDMGVKLALDDFGTGYSSLSHLSQYPFDILKIDKSFVRNIEREDQSSLLKAVVAFAHSLNYELVAEGVETELQRDLCTKLGVNRLQGYLFSRPLPAHEFEENWIC